jgi:hypothetical protein
MNLTLGLWLQNPTDAVEEITNFKQEVETKKVVATTSGNQSVTKTITAIVGGKKRILMAVPKNMYMSAVKTGKIPFAKPLSSSQPNKLPTQGAANNDSSNQKGVQLQEESVPPKACGAAKRKLPQIIRCDEELSRTEIYVPLGKNSSAYTRIDVPQYNYKEQARVFQVAPKLPVQAAPVTVSTFDWKTLTPDGWQDWPVPIDVFLASAVQLKNNYMKLFPKSDRMDIETTLHLAANYKSLGNEAKAHVRARVHHFLKILQLEKTKLSASNENSEN